MGALTFKYHLKDGSAVLLPVTPSGKTLPSLTSPVTLGVRGQEYLVLLKETQC